MRGMFTAGVTDVMMEQGITFDGAVGVSAGAAFGTNYKSRQIGRTIRYNKRFCNDPRYCGLRSLLTTGNLYNTEFAYRELPLQLDVFDFETYRSNPMEFYVVCTDVNTGKAVYHKYESRDDHVFEWIRASSSMPLVSRFVEIEGQTMLDGALADSIPVRFFESIGYDRNVVILTQPKGFQKERDKLFTLMRLRYRRYPKLVEAIASRHRVYNDTLSYIGEKEKDGTLLVIRPEAPLPVSRTEKDPAKLRQAYEAGRKVAAAQIQRIQHFLAP